jgi:hypothetical protein
MYFLTLLELKLPRDGNLSLLCTLLSPALRTVPGTSKHSPDSGQVTWPLITHSHSLVKSECLRAAAWMRNRGESDDSGDRLLAHSPSSLIFNWLTWGRLLGLSNPQMSHAQYLFLTSCEIMYLWEYKLSKLATTSVFMERNPKTGSKMCVLSTYKYRNTISNTLKTAFRIMYCDNLFFYNV